MGRRRRAKPREPAPRRPRSAWQVPAQVLGALLLIGGLGLGWSAWQADRFHQRYDADYVGSPVCGECHRLNHEQWVRSPHANMVREPTPETVIGDFDDGEFRLPEHSPDPLAGQVVARSYTRDGSYFLALRHPGTGRFVEFPIRYVIGYQYRQEYVTPEAGGVLRRLPLQWSTARQGFFPYWNIQEGSDQTLDDLWAQMRTTNSAWNLYCARCHVTDLEVHAKSAGNRHADVSWLETGIGCEACHGPGSLHVEYMREGPGNRLAMWVQNHLRGRPVAYIASAAKLPKGESLSVCARCHGADIFAAKQDVYRRYEPGYSRSGRTNDLSAHFFETPITPGRDFPTLEVWDNGAPKGIGMLFRSFIESRCYAEAEVRCYDCHNPHDNKQPTVPGILHATRVSNAYCEGCHAPIGLAPTEHTRHRSGEPGSFCYDCHLPAHITKLNRGIWERTRSHEMSSIPAPEESQRHGLENAPNACSDCHAERGLDWVLDQYRQLWPADPETANATPIDAPKAD